MKKVSIVVPIYNAEETLSKCLDSILNQTYKNIEVICINDGSKDNSIEIIKKYQKKDSRITFINQKINQGPAITKNKGIENATGDYICFVDSDDYISEIMIEHLEKFITKNKVDIVRCHYNNYIDGILNNVKFNFATGILSKEEKENFVNALISGKCPAYMQLIMLKRSLIINNKITIGNQYYIEDLMFYIKILSLTNKVGILNENLYNYINNSNGLTFSIEKEKIMKRIDGLLYFNDNVKHYLKEYQCIIADNRCTALLILFLYQLYNNIKNSEVEIKETLQNKKVLTMMNNVNTNNYDTFTKVSYKLSKRKNIKFLFIWFRFAKIVIKMKGKIKI